MVKAKGAVAKEIDRTAVDYIKKLWPRRVPVMKAIRNKCLYCTNDQPKEIRECASVDCPLWPFRMGHDIYSRKGKNLRKKK